MRFRKFILIITWAIAGCAMAAPERKLVDGVTYHILTTSASQIRIVWKDEAGKQLRTLPEASAYLESKSLKVETLMNGGIFEPEGIPSGLLIQDGKQLQPVNRRDGAGNFFLKPNGIFLIGNHGASIIATDEFPPNGLKIQYAVQSGPLLLRRGKVHPSFNANSSSRLHRNGVGVTKDGKVVLAMSDFHSPKFPNLHEFARLFQSLGCDDALFLDGDLSQMHSGNDLKKASNRFGSMIAVVQAEKAAE